MFSNTVQPSLISLFSSTGSHPLQLFSEHVDKSLPEDSLICLLDDATSEPKPPAPAVLISSSAGENLEDRTLCQTVLHIQSPTIQKTYIRIPPATAHIRSLDITLPWIHLQARNLEREWAFEVGVIDQVGRHGVIRSSTFQKEPSLKIMHNPPLLHIPLRFPTASSRPLTSWTTISLNLPSTMPQFQVVAAAQSTPMAVARGHERAAEPSSVEAVIPSARFAKVSYVKVYASCRLRRIWFSDTARSTNAAAGWPWEFELYAKSSSSS